MSRVSKTEGCSTLGRFQDACKGSHFIIEGELYVISSCPFEEAGD